ncbi:alkaline ceramidase 2-like isoform X1 [Lytechinus variegatus]|uniref:alkaline ceramidase 2-like isoform X1 n=2 Tax=Lytechinus variegatus TaxID=7654 RepID=UPI001BB257F2|nr:alkaline ceramidase 2-like isoform X1 [Lytechinus variegatus]
MYREDKGFFEIVLCEQVQVFRSTHKLKVGINQAMDNLERGSAAIDWCENNYAIVPGIAEFYNTVSNILFFIIPPLLLYLFRQYAVWYNWHVNIMWILLMVVGIFSCYFHATLSMFGQLLDEVAIIWVVLCGVALWYPRRYYPAKIHGSRKKFKQIMLVFTVASTGLAMVRPAVNSFVMMSFIGPCICMMILELRRAQCPRVVKLGKTCAFLWVVSVTCWLSDRFLCDFWQSLSLPYLHCAWHIMVFISAYTGCVLFAYFDAMNECPEMGPVLRYWPKDSWVNAGIPYVTLQCAGNKPGWD